jgi:RNA polymerase II-associated factor 1
MPHPPPIAAADRALMRPPNALGKGNSTDASGISFLRRTEYSTSHTAGGMRFESSSSSNTMRIRKKRRGGDTSVDDPINITRHILKGFNIAYPADAYNGPDSAENLRAAETTPQERAAWNAPKNPRNPSLKLLDSYPLLPDWDATPDTGAYMVFKYMAPPINNPLDPSYDPRLDVALLRPAGQTIKDQEIYFKELEANKADPSHPVPVMRYQFEFFLPPSRAKISGIKRNFSTNDPDDPAYVDFDTAEPDEDGSIRKSFKFENVRTYETSTQVGDAVDHYGDVVALALHDPERHREDRLRQDRLQKAAYFYPVIQKTSIRPRRPGRVDLVEEQPRVDVIEAAGREPLGEAERRNAVRRRAEGIET